MADKKRRPLRVTTVIGEILILSGLGVLGYIVWQPWHTGTTVQNEQTVLAEDLSLSWVEREYPSYSDGEVPVSQKVSADQSFAVLHVPAFGKRYANVIAEGTSEWGVLHLSDKGIGRYESTQLFGEKGNVALAAHRSGPLINPFKNIDNLRLGDPLFVETEDGWYTYRYRSTEYVYPDEVDVLNPFPREDSVEVDDRILTLTSCHPREWGSQERVIAYAVFEGFTSHADGPPEEFLEWNPNYRSRV